ncbi:FkbM family methyltransferase [Spartinivicinus ruber]|uniref:FkbM family methyltransferase n=1 Tax=Spartinivicinus ruber TaxID=2683272 RepID=UPI0013D76558|nr:FkbM family methyltransferase [Spartinivicinus ruber]
MITNELQNQTHAVVEGFPLSPVQAGALAAYQDRHRDNVWIECAWDSPASVQEVRTRLEEAVSAHGIFSVRIHIEQFSGESLQVLGEGQIRIELVEDRDIFDNLLSQRFELTGVETLRVAMLVNADGLIRLGLSAPPYITDIDGLLRCLGKDLPTEELMFQHFSEWCLEQSGSGMPPSIASSLVSFRPALGNPEAYRTSQVAKIITSDQLLSDIQVVSATYSVLMPVLEKSPNGHQCITVSADGRFFEDFGVMAGPFRVAVPLLLEAKQEIGVNDLTGRVKKILAENTTKIQISGMVHTKPQPCLVTSVSCPATHEVFEDASIKLETGEQAELSILITQTSNSRNIQVASTLADVDDAGLEALVRAIADALGQMEDSSCSFNLAQLIGCDRPDFPAVASTRKTIIDLFRETISHIPEEVAFITDEYRYHFWELDQESEALAARLAKEHAPGSRIMIFADRSFDAMVSMFGVLKAGMVCVPVMQEYPDRRILDIHRLSGAMGAVAEPSELERARRLTGGKVLAARGHAPQQKGELVQASYDAESCAYILFTSGSTGHPKGVAVTHASVSNLLNALKNRIYAGATGILRMSVNAPLAFDASMKQFFQAAIGRTIVPIPADVRRDPESMIEYVERMEIEALDVTPTILKAMIAAGFGPDKCAMPRWILVGGEAMDQELWDIARAWQDCEVWNVYGPTEATVNTLVARVKDFSVPTLGYPLENIHVACVDENGLEVPVGATGELIISGAGIAQGYVGASESEQVRFSRSGSGAATYLSGDLVRKQSNGSYAFVSRCDDQVKIAGQRMELGEVKSCLVEMPEVSDAAVIIDKRMDGAPRLVAAVVTLNSGIQLEEKDDYLVVDLPTGHKVASVNVNETNYQFKEIFEDRIYTSPDIRYPKDAVVFDVGANIGMFSMFVAQNVPHAKIFAFEPLAPIRKRLESNVTRYVPNAKVLPYGLSDHKGEVEFTYYPGYSMMSSRSDDADAAMEKSVIRTYLSNAADGGDESAAMLHDNLEKVLEGRFDAETHACQLRTLSSVIDELELEYIDILKIDVQRAELDVLKGIEARHFSKIRCVSLEIHDDPKGKTSGRVKEVSDLLEGAGFIVKTSQDEYLIGTDRWNCVAYRPVGAERDTREYVEIPITQGKVDVPLNTQEIRDRLAKKLPAYMIPDTVLTVEALPMTAQGKLDKCALLDLADREESHPLAMSGDNPVLSGQPAVMNDKVGSRLFVVHNMLEVWREVLRRPGLGEDDDFFHNGGDSIRAILMQSKLRKLGIEISLRDLNANPTVTTLADIVAEPASEQSNLALQEEEDQAIASLLEIWRMILRKPDLGEEDDFFHNGGDSIRAILMQSEARKAGISISLRELNNQPTVAGLLATSKGAVKSALEATSAKVPENSSGGIEWARKPGNASSWVASGMQRMMLTASMIRNDPQVYHNATVTPVLVRYRHECFADVLRALRRAHPILKSRLVFNEAGMSFEIDPALENAGFEYHDLTEVEFEKANQIIQEAVYEERSTPFNPHKGDLVRFQVFERAVDRFDILVAEHHAALDGLSLNAMITELVRRYMGQPVETSDDIAVFEALASDETAAGKSNDSRCFWQKMFVGKTSSEPVVPVRSVSDTTDMHQVDVLSSAEAYDAIGPYSRHLGVSTKALLFGLHASAMSVALGNRPSSLGCVYSLRPEVEGSELAIGMFLNVLPVPLSESGDFVVDARAFDAFDRQVFTHKAISHEQLSHWIGDHAEIDSIFNFIQFNKPDESNGDYHQVENRYFAVDAMMPIAVDWDLSGNRLTVGFQYDACKLDSTIAKRIGDEIKNSVDQLLKANVSNTNDLIAAQVLKHVSKIGECRAEPTDWLCDLGFSSLQRVRLAGALMEQMSCRFALPEFVMLETVEAIIEYCQVYLTLRHVGFNELTTERVDKPSARVIGFQQVGVAPSVLDPWCDLLPKDVALHGLRYPDFDNLPDIPFQVLIQALAKALHPLADVPLVFVGSCFGAVLAYETARLLQIEPVAMIVIGSGAPNPDGPAPGYHLLSDQELKDELRRLKSMPEHFLDNNEILAPVCKALRGMSKLATSYESELKPLKVCQVVSIWPTDDITVSKEGMEEWLTLTKGEFTSLEIAGEHAVLIDDPKVVFDRSGIRSYLELS